MSQNEIDTIEDDAYKQKQSLKIQTDIEALPERTIVVQDGITDLPWKKKTKEMDVFTSAIVSGTTSTIDFSFELGRATPLTKHMARNERVLQTPQHVANINIQIYPDNENQQEKLKRINNNNNNNNTTASNYLKITNVYGSLITNKTYYHKKKYPDGSTFYMQYKTISIEHSCPSGGWFPKLWKEGINGKYGRVTLVRFKSRKTKLYFFLENHLTTFFFLFILSFFFFSVFLFFF